MNLLSVDWDFFFPEPEPGDPMSMMYDWGHREARLFIDHLWLDRAAAFLRQGISLPGLSGEQEGFWGRFRFHPDAELFWGESHAAAGLHEVEDRITCVWNFDAHHDAGYQKLSDLTPALGQGIIHCDDWMVFYALTRPSRRARRNRTLQVVYPRWKAWALEMEPQPAVWNIARRVDDGRHLPDLIQRVFLCRSGAWVPSWLDPEWEKFLEACPVKRRTRVGEWVDRKFDLADAQERARQTQAMLEQFENQRRETGT